MREYTCDLCGQEMEEHRTVEEFETGSANIRVLTRNDGLTRMTRDFSLSLSFGADICESCYTLLLNLMKRTRLDLLVDEGTCMSLTLHSLCSCEKCQEKK